MIGRQDISAWGKTVWETVLNLTYTKEGKAVKAVIWLDHTLWGLVVKNDRILSSVGVPLDELTEERLGAAFLQLREEGFSGQNITLAVNFPTLRVYNKRFPGMEEGDLEETIYWEEDRLFRMKTPMVLGYDVMHKELSGWDIHVEGIPGNLLALWQKGAEKGGMKITEALSIIGMPLKRTPHVILYGRKHTGLLVYRKESIYRTRVVKEEGEAALFMEKLIHYEELDELSIHFIPLSDCSEEKRGEWKSYLAKEADSLRISFADEGVQIINGFQEEETGFDENRKVLTHMAYGNVVFPLAERKRKWINQENRYLRYAEVSCLLSFLFFLYSFGNFCLTYRAQEAAEREGIGLYQKKERIIELMDRRKAEGELAAFLKKLDRKDGHWGNRLAMMSASLPSGIVLSRISEEGKGILISGTAGNASALSDFQGCLSSAWGGRSQVMRKENPKTGLMDFTLRWEGYDGL